MQLPEQANNQDISIGSGWIVAVKDGWALPGGGFTKNRAVAIRAAKGIHRASVKR